MTEIFLTPRKTTVRNFSWEEQNVVFLASLKLVCILVDLILGAMEFLSSPRQALFAFAMGEPNEVCQEAKNWPNIPLQEKLHRGILRGLRNISATP